MAELFSYYIQSPIDFIGRLDLEGNKIDLSSLRICLPRPIPKRLSLHNHAFSIYYWFEFESLKSVFERFYGAHPDTKAEFIIRIDVLTNRYELSLFRQGLKEPVVIPESAYQLIVFKNKFEDYRSENYNQPRGAWIW